jgi:hypothetical protein
LIPWAVTEFIQGFAIFPAAMMYDVINIMLVLVIKKIMKEIRDRKKYVAEY